MWDELTSPRSLRRRREMTLSPTLDYSGRIWAPSSRHQQLETVSHHVDDVVAKEGVAGA